MAAPFYNQNLETPEKLQAFFEQLFAAGFKPDIIAVQDGVGASDAGKPHASTATVGNYERVIAKTCTQYGIKFWVDQELFRTDDSHALADSARLSAQLDTALAAGASKVIVYDLAVLGNAALDSLEKWFQRDTSQTTSIKIRRNLNKSQKFGGPCHKEIRYYKLNGARVNTSR